MTLDFVAQRYGILPSKLVEEGSTFDVMIANVAQNYIAEKQEEARAKAEGRAYVKPAPKLTEQQMKDMIASARNKGK